MDSIEEVYSIWGAATCLGVSHTVIRYAIRKGELRAIPVISKNGSKGHSFVIIRKDLEDWIPRYNEKHQHITLGDPTGRENHGTSQLF